MKPNPQEFPEEKADRCVMCGLCLPYCPTYGLFKLESESPRGRIALMRALAKGDLLPDVQLRKHLDHCLLCRACETACPAGVPFGELMDTTRTLLAKPNQQPSTTAGNLQRLSSALYIYRRSGLQRVARALRLPQLFGLHRLERLLPSSVGRRELREYYAAHGKQKGTVGLFTGCTGAVLDGETLAATVTLLTRLGYNVIIPKGQVCCGAPQRHGGLPDQARSKALENIAAFPLEQLDALVHVASGCGSELLEYNRITGLDPEQCDRAALLSSKVVEICAFLANSRWPENLLLDPLECDVALHTPCSQRRAF
ncbi:MAG TPA: (Fe-S)-binding protein, partial [Gammaproteobacteria bacterium]|nr:(Fe-S)-binding protein [Gammaproteobacteria bacterium]